MKKIAIILCVLVLASCAKGMKDVENKHWAYVHQVIEQSQSQKVALANVGNVSNVTANYEITARSVKLVLKNCKYEDEWIDEHYYTWNGSLENTHKSFTYTNGYGTQRTIPVYTGDCSIETTKKIECTSWETGCVIPSENEEEK